ncbi:MAG: hypothetical protein WC508_01150 [Patescibacteria group bacterium]
MEKEIFYSPEQNEQLVTAYTIDCRRHSERDRENINPLTENGEKKAKAVTLLKPPYNPGDCYVSEVIRTDDTAQKMQETIWQEGDEVLGLGKGRIIQSRHLGADDFWGGDEGRFLNQYREIMREKGKAAAEQWYLDFKDKKPFEETISPQEAAAHYSVVILGLVDQLNNSQQKARVSKIPKTIVSHDVMMHPFLYYSIGENVETDKDALGDSFIEKIGGPIKETEGFSLNLEKVDNEVKATLILRDKEYDIDLSKLRKLVGRYER